MNHVYSAKEVMPDLDEVVQILTAKFSYENAKNTKTKSDFDAWSNESFNFFNCVPRGVAYTVSQKSYKDYCDRCKSRGWRAPKSPESRALRFFIIAVAVGWDELVQELKVVLKYWGYKSTDIQQYAQQVWQMPENSEAIAKTVELAQSSNKIKLVEAVEKHDKLNNKLFTKEGALKDRVRDKMLEIVDEFLADLKEQEIEIKVDDILFIGSNASYNYTKDSDIDLHILANSKSTKYSVDIAEALYSAYRSLFNKNLDIKLFDIPLELFVETENSARVSNGIYSVKNNKWIKKPVHEDIPEYDTEALNKLVDKWEAKCKNLIEDIKADKLDDEKRVVKMLEDIYNVLRKKGISKGEYSIENLAFKELRNKGYLDKLKEYRNELVSKRLSLEEKLTKESRVNIYNQLVKAAGTQPIIQNNGMFFIYNLKASEINSVLSNVRKLPFVLEATANENGKYDFSNTLDLAINKMPKKYYDIRGQIYT
jgi:predicted nucleotidyltransferase